MEATGLVSMSSNIGKKTVDLSGRTDMQAFSNKEKDSSSSPAAAPMVSKLSLMGFKVMEGRVSGKVMGEREKKVFPCNYCQRKFSSFHALGGHQKMHKRERTLIKLNGGSRCRDASHLIHGFTNDHITHKFPVFASLYKAATSRPLSIQAQSSTVQKPYNNGRQNRTWPEMMNLMQQQEGSGRLLGDELYDRKVMPMLRNDNQTTIYHLVDSGRDRSIDPEFLIEDEPNLDLTLKL